MSTSLWMKRKTYFLGLVILFLQLHNLNYTVADCKWKKGIFFRIRVKLWTRILSGKITFRLTLYKKFKYSITTFYFIKNSCDPSFLRLLLHDLIPGCSTVFIPTGELLGVTLINFESHIVKLILNCPTIEGSYPLFCYLKIF